MIFNNGLLSIRLVQIQEFHPLMMMKSHQKVTIIKTTPAIDRMLLIT